MKAAYQVADQADSRALAVFFSGKGSIQVPLSELIENAELAVDERIATSGFVDCVNGPFPGAPVPPMCMVMEFDAADVDGDDDVDLRDMATFQRCFNPGGGLVMGCAP